MKKAFLNIAAALFVAGALVVSCDKKKEGEEVKADSVDTADVDTAAATVDSAAKDSTAAAPADDKAAPADAKAAPADAKAAEAKK